MNPSVSNLSELLGKMQPVLNRGVYVFSSVPFDTVLSKIQPIATIREPEGLTVIAEEGKARAANLECMFRAAWITLSVHSDLEAIGLTAAFAAALSEAGISCNVVAGAYHDHIFVPIASAPAAMETLKALQTGKSRA